MRGNQYRLSPERTITLASTPDRVSKIIQKLQHAIGRDTYPLSAIECRHKGDEDWGGVFDVRHLYLVSPPVRLPTISPFYLPNPLCTQIAQGKKFMEKTEPFGSPVTHFYCVPSSKDPLNHNLRTHLPIHHSRMGIPRSHLLRNRASRSSLGIIYCLDCQVLSSP